MPRVRQSRTGEMGSRRSRTALSPSELFRLVPPRRDTASHRDPGRQRPPKGPCLDARRRRPPPQHVAGRHRRCGGGGADGARGHRRIRPVSTRIERAHPAPARSAAASSTPKRHCHRDIETGACRVRGRRNSAVGRSRPRRTRAHQTSPRAETCSLPLSDGWPNLRLRARRTGTSQRRCSSARKPSKANLGRIYRKLGINSRSELGRVIGGL